MAVIREQRQFKIGPIGVARVSGNPMRPTSIASNIVGEQISQSANRFAEIF